ncbi:HlyD family type I secretion periplasmic adaptor subunit [Beijerinckia sp. L45]|uniref:HlyD family type I secretion periplasmic adaptor subunit n=1 Tax=Beijerinckia sp. L45 TaxID=1641855 RepID=UPI001FEF14C7|nr:HlyD family type I secretion periplasmic adaptor subunit [Beijerinckia sp. L45]
MPRQTRGHILTGFWISAACIGGFGVWAATAPIAGAVVTSGAFVATGQNKIVQNLEGGVIAKLLVHEGDIVEQGQELIRLDETAAKVDMRRLFLKEMRLEAVEARLLAEAGARPNLAIPVAYEANAQNAEENTVIENQMLTFETHRRGVLNEITTLQQSIGSLEEHLNGTETQLTSVVRQGELYQEEIEAKKSLLAQGMVKRPELLALLRARAAMDGEVGRLKGDIGDTKDKIARANEQIAGVRNTAVKTAVEQLVDIRADLYDTRERMRTAKNIVDRVKIAAPVRGAVIKLGYHTAGGVIEPGKPIMEILPLNDELLIEARIRSQDIDSVKKGADAMVRLSALSARVTPMVTGKVVYISADSLQEDPRIDRSAGVYMARVRIDKDQLPLIKDFVPTPGMPAEIYIKTGERTFLAYLLRPLKDSMARAFRER